MPRIGFKHSEETKQKMREKALKRDISYLRKYSLNENNYQWKGDNATYTSIHQWVARKKGKAKKCQNCGVTSDKKMIYWANKDHSYKKILEDYIPLCNSCHWHYDIKYNHRFFNHFKPKDTVPQS